MCFIPGIQRGVGEVVDWVRQMEHGGTWSKVAGWATAFFTSVVFSLTLVGFPLVVSAWCIYHNRDKCPEFFDRLSICLEIAELRGKLDDQRALPGKVERLQKIIKGQKRVIANTHFMEMKKQLLEDGSLCALVGSKDALSELLDKTQWSFPTSTSYSALFRFKHRIQRNLLLEAWEGDPSLKDHADFFGRICTRYITSYALKDLQKSVLADVQRHFLVQEWCNDSGLVSLVGSKRFLEHVLIKAADDFHLDENDMNQFELAISNALTQINIEADVNAIIQKCIKIAQCHHVQLDVEIKAIWIAKKFFKAIDPIKQNLVAIPNAIKNAVEKIAQKSS